MIQTPSVINLIKIYNNTKVRAGETKLSSDEFINFVDKKMQEAIDKLKTDVAKKRKEDLKNKLIEYLSSKSTELDSVFTLHDSLTQAKILIIKKLQKIFNQ